MRLTTHYHHTRYEENGSEGKFSLRMPRRNSSIFKPPVLIQFQVTADTDRHHQQIEHAKGPEAGGGAQRQEPAAAHERPHPQHPAWAPAVQTPARPEAGRPALGPRQGKDERHGGVAGAKARADRGDEHGEAPIDGGLVQGAEKAAQPDHPPTVKKCFARRPWRGCAHAALHDWRWGRAGSRRRGATMPCRASAAPMRCKPPPAGVSYCRRRLYAIQSNRKRIRVLTGGPVSECRTSPPRSTSQRWCRCVHPAGEAGKGRNPSQARQESAILTDTVLSGRLAPFAYRDFSTARA